MNGGGPLHTTFFPTLINREGRLCSIQRLKPICDTLLSSDAFNYSLGRYMMVFSTDTHPEAVLNPGELIPRGAFSDIMYRCANEGAEAGAYTHSH